MVRLRLAIFVFCAAGLLAQVPVTFQYFYDDTGQLIKVVDSTGVTIEYVYDPVGNMLETRRSLLPSPGALSIFSFSPQQGGPFTLLTIQGQGFSTTPAANIVRFNGVAGTVISATANILVVQVPTGSTTSSITVSVGANSATSSSNFTVLPAPVITSVTPQAIEPGFPPASLQVTGGARLKSDSDGIRPPGGRRPDAPRNPESVR